MFIFPAPAQPAAEYDWLWLSGSLWAAFEDAQLSVPCAQPRISSGPIKCSNSVIIRRSRFALNCAKYMQPAIAIAWG